MLWTTRESVREPAISAMLVGKFGAEAKLLRDLFSRFGWSLCEAANERLALARLRKSPVQVVLSLPGGSAWSWQTLLEKLRRVVPTPVLIVTSRTADEYLWAEVLNVGGFDVLAQPFNREEVEQVLASARRQFEPKPMRSVAAAPSAAA